MLRFLLDKFRDAPGPLKQTRLIASDLAEEILDLAEYYISRRKSTCDSNAAPTGHAPPCSGADAPSTETQGSIDRETNPPKAPANGRAKEKKDPGPPRTLDVPEKLATALDIPQNKKKQEFKVLAILWDARQRELGTLSAKAVSEHGAKLGLAIRHENVRKVIRMRLDKQVETRTEQVGSGSIYRYQISPAGTTYFESKYLV